MSMKSGEGDAGSSPQVWKRAMRAFVIAASLGTLAGMSFVFLPPGPREYRDGAVASPGHLVRAGTSLDRSPLRGVLLQIPDVNVRRLDRVAVITFTCDVFDRQNNLNQAARDRLEILAQKLQGIRSQIAIEVTGYSPDGDPQRGYTAGLLRAAHVADCLVSVAAIPPSAVALRSLGDTEVHGPADKPHAVVIMISDAEDSAARLASAPTAGF